LKKKYKDQRARGQMRLEIQASLGTDTNMWQG